MPRLPVPLPTPGQVIDNTWRTQLNAAPTLWYVRRRNLNYKSEVVGSPVRTVSPINLEILTESVRAAGLVTRLSRVRSSATTEADVEVTRLLATPRFTESRLLLSSAVRELEVATTTPVEAPGEAPAEEGGQIDELGVLRVGSRFSDPRLGEGISRLEAATPELAEDRVVRNLAASGMVPELDEVARSLPPAELSTFAAAIAEESRRGDTQRVNELISTRLREIRR
jgi:hypothetical protein